MYHESTINVLNYYSNHGYPDFKETADFLSIIRNWFNTVNVKSSYHVQKRNKTTEPVENENRKEITSCLSKFHLWMIEWLEWLSQQTFRTAIRTAGAFRTAIRTAGAFRTAIRTAGAFRTAIRTAGAFRTAIRTAGAFQTAIRTAGAFPQLINYLFDEIFLEYILTGHVSSDFNGGRFGCYRQLLGANYYNSVLQFLQIEKTIRIRSLVKMGFNLSNLRDI